MSYSVLVGVDAVEATRVLRVAMHCVTTDERLMFVHAEEVDQFVGALVAQVHDDGWGVDRIVVLSVPSIQDHVQSVHQRLTGPVWLCRLIPGEAPGALYLLHGFLRLLDGRTVAARTALNVHVLAIIP